MEEVWKEIEGYRSYQVSSMARVRTKKGRILKTPLCHGYPCLNLYENKKVRRWFVHRLVAIAFIPNPENKPFINHINGVRNDNRLENLEWCTQAENIAHSFRIGNHRPVEGERHPLSKLTQVKAEEIRKKYIRRVYTQKMLAAEYGVHQGVVLAILQNRSYKTPKNY